jgi:hypothetical protein
MAENSDHNVFCLPTLVSFTALIKIKILLSLANGLGSGLIIHMSFCQCPFYVESQFAGIQIVDKKNCHFTYHSQT